MDTMEIAAAPLAILAVLALLGIAYWIATRNIRASKYPYGRRRRTRGKKWDGK